jgi:hypothetical protein
MRETNYQAVIYATVGFTNRCTALPASRAPGRLRETRVKFPEPTVDINEIRKKYHAIMAQEG